MKVGGAQYMSGGTVEFAEYLNGQTAIRIIGADGELECVATVNLEEHGAPEPGRDQVWLKTWSENIGVAEALEAAEIVRVLASLRFHCAHDAYAVLADLTPEAIAERDRQRGG